MFRARAAARSAGAGGDGFSLGILFTLSPCFAVASLRSSFLGLAPPLALLPAGGYQGLLEPLARLSGAFGRRRGPFGSGCPGASDRHRGPFGSGCPRASFAGVNARIASGSAPAPLAPLTKQ